ncbi:transporter [Ectobacillus sp. SYSU M60031]|uniref:Transporter n=1 Tax=Ectobacillus ponti TaxID=2961894 RepID=A0AA42BPF0_9BACI|nr:transporter [Ectobacillus ponti]MCP8968682.1 transporter [Ectobacillus ponti]
MRQFPVITQPSQPYIPPFPPFFPGQGQGQGGYTPPPPPGGGGGQQGAPQTPPPSFTPPRPPSQASLYAVDPGAIRRCLYRYTYVWLRNGRGFWFYPIYVGRNSVAGYRWRPNQYRWSYVGLDLNSIEYFECSF